jgi:hypothetical protein
VRQPAMDCRFLCLIFHVAGYVDADIQTRTPIFVSLIAQLGL